MGWDETDVRVKRAVVSAAVGVLLAGGGLGLKELAPGDRLAEACNGMLPVADVLAATGITATGLGGPALDLAGHEFDAAGGWEPDGLATTCRVNDLEVWIDLATSTTAPWAFQGVPDSPLPVPLNAGWSGFLLPGDGDSGERAVSVLVDCADWHRRDGSGLKVTAVLDAIDSGSPAAALAVARVATGAAERAAERTGCASDLGGRIDTLDTAAATPAPVPADRADGTCAGVTSHPRVRETAARTAPVESCLLTGELVLRSYYGPYVTGDERFGYETPTGALAYAVWGSAECGGALDTAVYTLRPLSADDGPRSFTSEPPTGSEYGDLRHFAKASAERHGCSSPDFPAEPRA
ncbi:hypothetical protein [Streptomonospora wellingtoniae]|uniref:Uncharacterized protein n=1 Tax=Streptomonospora wellingtoniae TaxID=3075544 RepID=A0ABU2KU19_9ACTN|nr:hypothetical protein [Streptomonospora sp. DSM 45055]MDT0302745.1 hypothetical protein [Streptomonospora sp. DSM 45055]